MTSSFCRSESSDPLNESGFNSCNNTVRRNIHSQKVDLDTRVEELTTPSPDHGRYRQEVVHRKLDLSQNDRRAAAQQGSACKGHPEWLVVVRVRHARSGRDDFQASKPWDFTQNGFELVGTLHCEPDVGNRLQVVPHCRGPSALLGRLPQLAALVMSAACEVLAWNDLAAALTEDFATLAPQDRNLARKAFLGPGQGDRLYGISDDAEFRHSVVMQLRASLSRYPSDPAVSGLIQELRDGSAEFARLWDRHDVQAAPMLTKTPATGLWETSPSTATPSCSPTATSTWCCTPHSGDPGTPRSSLSSTSSAPRPLP
nr:hypothetical protein [Nakamurella sp. PAMC28650]